MDREYLRILHPRKNYLINNYIVQEVVRKKYRVSNQPIKDQLYHLIKIKIVVEV